MASKLITLPFRPTINLRGGVEAGAKLFVYSTGTTTPVSVYSDSALSTPLTNPVVADAFGVFPDVYYNDTQIVRVVIQQANGTVLSDTDPYVSDAASAEASADAAALSAAAAEGLVGPVYADTASGLAATTVGDFFAVNNSGTVTIYLNDGGTAVAQRTIVTADDLAASGGAALVGGIAIPVATRTALKALDTSRYNEAYLTEAGREGAFVFRSGDYSSEVTADTQEGIYIKADDTSASGGAWVRQYENFIDASKFGIAYGESVDHTATLNALPWNEIDFTLVISGDIRLDGTFSPPINSGYEGAGAAVYFTNKARVLRRSTNTSATTPLMSPKGRRFWFYAEKGALIKTENDSPDGIITLGHTNSVDNNFIATDWVFEGFYIRGQRTSGNKGIAVPSSQLTLGSSVANYFGRIANNYIEDNDIGIWLPDHANSHYCENNQGANLVTAMYDLEGSYGNSICGGFLHLSPNGNNLTGVRLRGSTRSGGTRKAERNVVYGFGAEPGAGTNQSYGCTLDADTDQNIVIMNDNTTGGTTDANTGNNVLLTMKQTALRDDTKIPGRFSDYETFIEREGTLAGSSTSTDLITLTTTSIRNALIVEVEFQTRLSSGGGYENNTKRCYSMTRGSSGDAVLVELYGGADVGVSAPSLDTPSVSGGVVTFSATTQASSLTPSYWIKVSIRSQVDGPNGLLAEA